MTSQATPLTLRPLSRSDTGEPLHPLSLLQPGPYLIGRSNEADWPIPEATVSRRHASLACNGGSWFLTDLQSRHGTTLNGKRLEPGRPTPIEPGDEIGLGAWRCRCASSSGRPGATTSYVEGPAPGESISRIDPAAMAGLAQRGLEALLGLSADLESARDPKAVAEATVRAIGGATGCRRVVVVRPNSEVDLETLASIGEQAPRLSRSLIDAAARDGLVELRVSGQTMNQAHSIMALNIRSAICAPIMAGGSAAAFVLLDTRDAEDSLPSDAAAFCQSVARLAGLTLERIQSTALQERHRQLQQDLDAARRAQELLSPPARGSFGPLSYVFECIPGRVVAGDLFDIFPLSASRTAFFLGDVSGKGVGAGMLMAAVQSQLRTKLLSGADLAAAMAAVNADLHARTESSKFVTLLAGVVDAERAALEIVDAGHGFCVLAGPGQAPARVESPNGFPLGVVEDAEYELHTAPFGAGSALALFSDGAVEQPDLQGREFGLPAVIASIARAGAPERTARAIMDDVKAHAAAHLADDLTVASLWMK